MQNNSTTKTPAQRLEQARARVHVALRTAEEGPLDYQSSDDIARALVGVLRDLEELALEVAVMARRVRA